jgi:hypothetical protein
VKLTVHMFGHLYAWSLQRSLLGKQFQPADRVRHFHFKETAVTETWSGSQRWTVETCWTEPRRGIGANRRDGDNHLVKLRLDALTPTFRLARECPMGERQPKAASPRT